MTRDAAQYISPAILACIATEMFNIEPLFIAALTGAEGLQESQASWIVALELAGLGGASAVLASGRPNMDRRRLVRVAVLSYVVANFLTLFTVGWQAIASVRFAAGLMAEGPLYAVATLRAAATTRPHVAFAWITTSQVACAVLSLSLLPVLASGWGLAGLIVPVSALSLLVLFVPMADSQIAGGVAISVDHARRLALPPLACACAIFVWHVGVGTYWALTGHFAAQAGLGAVAAGRILALSTAVGLLGALLPALLGPRFSRQRLFLMGMTLQLIGIGILAAGGSAGGFATSATMWNFSWNLALPYALAFFSEIDGGRGLIQLSPATQGIGLGVGAPVGMAIRGAAGDTAVLCFYAAAVIISTTLLLLTYGYSLRSRGGARAIWS